MGYSGTAFCLGPNEDLFLTCNTFIGALNGRTSPLAYVRTQYTDRYEAVTGLRSLPHSLYLRTSSGSGRVIRYAV